MLGLGAFGIYIAAWLTIGMHMNSKVRLHIT